MKNNVKCNECVFGIATGISEAVFLCDNPNLKTFCKNVKHGKNFSCGHGDLWTKEKQAARQEAGGA